MGEPVTDTGLTVTDEPRSAQRTGPADPRYDALAGVLLASDNPVKAIAHLLGDHEARLDIAIARITHLEAVLDAGKNRG